MMNVRSKAGVLRDLHLRVGVPCGPKCSILLACVDVGFSGVNRGQIMNLPLPEIGQALIESHARIGEAPARRSSTKLSSF